jgi:hypothetical protein
VRQKTKPPPGREIYIRGSAAEYLGFVAPTGDNHTTVEVRNQDENIWLTQKMVAVLYDVDVRTISEHLSNIFSGRRVVGGFSYPEFPDNCH